MAPQRLFDRPTVVRLVQRLATWTPVPDEEYNQQVCTLDHPPVRLFIASDRDGTSWHAWSEDETMAIVSLDATTPEAAQLEAILEFLDY